MKRIIRKVAVLGSGVMGSRIAAHFANVGVDVLLLDIVPTEMKGTADASSKSAKNKGARNKIVNESLQTALRSNPSPIYLQSFANRIVTGNFDDDLHRIAESDWIIEVVVERLDIKQALFAKVEEYRRPGTLVSSNTSGIPIKALAEGRSEDFKRHFCGTHFFNPPRYLKLLEIIPSAFTLPEVVHFLEDYGARFLGKKVVLCKDSPAFIANRIGVFSIQALFHMMEPLGLTIDEVDKLTGTVLGRPKSATFRTCDVVGLDTLAHVAQGLKVNCPSDERADAFQQPAFIAGMLAKGWLGSKSKQGFFKKIRKDDGGSEILSLNLKTLEYETPVKVKFQTLEQAKLVENLRARIPVLYHGADRAGDFYRRSFHALFAYVSHRIPEISDEIYRIDDAMRAGFGWEIGPFEYWDAIGLGKVLEGIKSEGYTVAPWVEAMQTSGKTSFYITEGGKRRCYDPIAGSYKEIPTSAGVTLLSDISENKIVWKNSGATIKDLGDGILNVEFHTKMNTIGSEVIQGLNKAIDLAEASYAGLVVSNSGENFSAGANVGMIFMMAAEQDYDELDMAVRAFQKTVTRMRFSDIPVVAAPHGLTLGGGCELSMHCDKVIAHAETYMGLVEFGVGVIPGGGGTKEFALRASDEYQEGGIRLNVLRNRFLTIGQAKVSTSAHEAFALGYLRKGIDEVVISREHQLQRAKVAALTMAEAGYTRPLMRKDIKVLGNEGLGIVYVGANSMESGHYISEHDRIISEKLGWVLCGGDLSEAAEVSEQYLLDLERRAFIELCATRKTMERMQSLVKTGKILRN
jgi:3-hydroxyacyl-CoA dehydrogenase